MVFGTKLEGKIRMISKRAAGFIKLLPKPIVKGLARVILDGYISEYANLSVNGMENLNGVKDPVIFVSNHLSNADGVVLHQVLKRNDVTYIAGVKLAGNPVTSLGLEYVKIIPINPNSADKSAIKTTVDILKSGKSICIFPEGTRSRRGSLIQAKKGVLLIAKLSGTSIVPIGISGTEKLLPINDRDMGEEKFQHADVTVSIGKPIYPPERHDGEGKHEYQDRAITYVMGHIAELLPEKYRGYYRL